VDDATIATTLDPTYSKAYARKARALIQLANFSGALDTVQEGIDKCPPKSSSLLRKELARMSILQKQHEKSLEFLQQKEYASAKSELGNLLRETTAPMLLLQAAQADLGMGLVDSARRLCLQAVRGGRARQEQQNNNNLSASSSSNNNTSQEEPLALLVQGQCNILSAHNESEDNQQMLESGIAFLRHAMRLDPDNQSAASVIKQWLKVSTLLKKARQAAFQRRFDQAFVEYSTCINTCPMLPPKAPLFSALYTERAKVSLRLKKYDAVLQDIALVVYHREDYIDAWLVRFAALHGKEEHETVLEETRNLMQTWGQNETRIRQAYEKADFEVRKAKRPDFYKMLKVSPIASEREIKKAYRVAAKDMHPDRFASATEAERLKAQGDFQTLSQGLEILSDDFQRKLYDEGYDLEEIKERVQAAEQAAHRPHYHGGYPGGYGGFHGGHGYQ